MVDTPVGLVLPDTSRASALDFAQMAERLGYDSVWTGELWGADAFVRLTEIACHTETVELGTAIVNVFSRSLAALAMAGASLARVSDGRFSMGLGTSTRKAVEDLHGGDFSRPVRRTREAATLISRFTGGDERVNFDGQMFSVADFPSLGVEFPLYNAALGPANRRATGAVFDGWMPNNVPFSALASAFDAVADAARSSGRDPAEITVAPWVPTVVSDDETEARAILRKNVAYFVGSGEGYRNAVVNTYQDEAAEIHERWAAGRHDTAANAVTDKMVKDLGIAGTPADARAQFAAFRERDLIDHPIVSIPNIADADLTEGTVEAFEPLL